MKIEDRCEAHRETQSSIFYPQSRKAEGERLELSQAEARRFSGPVHCRLCEPSVSRSRRSRTSISGFGDHRVANYTMLPQFHGLFSLYSSLCTTNNRLKVCATSMLSEGIEPPMTAQGRLIYSQVQCHSASSAIRRSCFYSVVKKQKERVLPHTMRRNGPLLLSLPRTGL